MIVFNKNNIVYEVTDFKMLKLRFKEEMFQLTPTYGQIKVLNAERKEGLAHILTTHQDNNN